TLGNNHGDSHADRGEYRDDVRLIEKADYYRGRNLPNYLSHSRYPDQVPTKRTHGVPCWSEDVNSRSTNSRVEREKRRLATIIPSDQVHGPACPRKMVGHGRHHLFRATGLQCR